MKEDRSPSFTTVLATVWKVFIAILLIPFLILLAYISAKVIPGSFVTLGAVSVLIACGIVYWRSGR